MDRTPNSCSLWDTPVSSHAPTCLRAIVIMPCAACFLGALQLVGSRAGKKELVDNAKVHATVFLGHPTDPNLEGFGLRVEITVEGCEDDTLIQAAHEVRSFFL
jgi:organic hydroperoxide reductase OsmC/OhrA